jgi:multidrug efflux pump subunit AcrA (membrane-fusion protein)
MVAGLRLHQTFTIEPGTNIPIFEVSLPKGGVLAVSFGTTTNHPAMAGAPPAKISEHRKLSERLALQRKKESELLSNYSEGNPVVTRLRAEIAESMKQKEALENEVVDPHQRRINLAGTNLAIIRELVAAGRVSKRELAEAERDLAVAQARGDSVTIARANLQFAEYILTLAREQSKVGRISVSELRSAEMQHAIAELELNQASKSSPPKQP